jgi:hypothetical protein
VSESRATRAAALPSAEPGAEIEWVRDGSESQRQPITTAALLAQRPKRAKGERHPLLHGARAEFDHARESRHEQYVRPYKRNLVDVFVSKDMVDKALKVAGDFFLALEGHGHRVMLAPSGAHYRHVDAEICEGHKDQQNFYHGPGSWSPARPTIVLVGEAAFGLTVFEVSEEVDVRYDSTSSKYVRVPPRKPEGEKQLRRALAPRYYDWTTKHWMPSGRLGIHAYAAEYNVEWECYWREAKAGELPGLFDAVAKELKGAVPKIKEREWAIQEEERKRAELEARRQKEETRRQKKLTETMSAWRLAREIRAYVAEVQAIVKDAEMKITEGGSADAELKWALAYADQLDPLTSWRRDVEREKAEYAARPCPNCGEVHGPGDDRTVVVDEAPGKATASALPGEGDGDAGPSGKP